ILERVDDEGPPRTLRFARSCSSALAPALMERLELALRVPVLEAYGMTEASHQMASNPLPPAKRLPGSVGVATGVEIRIVDGKGVGAAVQLAGEADERALADWCRERLAAFKVPEVIHILDTIPRTPTGKVQRKRIAEQLAQ